MRLIASTIPANRVIAPPAAKLAKDTTAGDVFAEISEMSWTLNKVLSDASTIKLVTAELENAVSALQTQLEKVESLFSDVVDNENNLGAVLMTKKIKGDVKTLKRKKREM